MKTRFQSLLSNATCTARYAKGGAKKPRRRNRNRGGPKLGEDGRGDYHLLTIVHARKPRLSCFCTTTEVTTLPLKCDHVK
jgi:hypothetical protein